MRNTALRSFHAWWQAQPLQTAIGAAILVLIARGGASILGILYRFGPDGNFLGFMSEPNWSLGYEVGFPVAVLLVGWLLQIVWRSVASLDRIILPVTGNAFLFSTALRARFERVWYTWLLPLSAILALGATVYFNRGPLLAPMLSPAEAHRLGAHLNDWLTVGASEHSHISRYFYLAFNTYMYAQQTLMIYAGLFVVLGVSYPLFIVMNQGLRQPPGNGAIKAPTTAGSVNFTRDYSVRWDCHDKGGRYGLSGFDKVFACWELILLLSLGIDWCMIQLELHNGGKIWLDAALVTAGSAILYIVFILGVVAPYLVYFPHDRTEGCPTPRPWPFGEWQFTMAFLGVTTILWSQIGPPVKHFITAQ